MTNYNFGDFKRTNSFTSRSRRSSFTTYASWFNGGDSSASTDWLNEEISLDKKSSSTDFGKEEKSTENSAYSPQLKSNEILLKADEETGTLALSDNDGSFASKEEHRQVRQYWRDIIFGFNTGLISTFVVTTGVLGGGMTTKECFIGGLVSAIGGSFTLVICEYLATHAQNEIDHSEVEIERDHILNHHEEEMSELGNIFDCIGVYDHKMCDKLSKYYVS